MGTAPKRFERQNHPLTGMHGFGPGLTCASLLASIFTPQNFLRRRQTRLLSPTFVMPRLRAAAGTQYFVAASFMRNHYTLFDQYQAKLELIVSV
jgi:hypothetical protein